MDEQPKQRVQIKRKVHSEEIHVFHSRVTLTECIEAAVRGATFEYISPITEALMDIDGIVMAQVHPYHIIVQKGEAFEWSEIEPAILRLFSSLHLDLPQYEMTAEDKEKLAALDAERYPSEG